MEAKFKFPVKVLIPKDKDPILAKASLKKLEGLIPEDVRGEKNIDLLPVVFNLAVVGVANLNDDLIDRQTAIDIYEFFVHRPFNIEHEREKIVGHIVGAGFSEYGTDEPLTLEQIQGMDVFNIAVSAVVYSTINEEVTSFLNEAADPTSDKYMKASASWELGFERNKILVGSKYINEGEIIEGEQVGTYEKFLKANGGEGVDEQGRRVYRLISSAVSQVLPLGGAITLAPAADVKGIQTFPNDMEEENLEGQEDNSEAQKQEEIVPEQEKKIDNEARDKILAEIMETWNNTDNLIKSAASISTSTTNKKDALKNNFSQKSNDCVKTDKEAMNKVEQFLDNLEESQAATFHEILKEKIEEAGKNYVAEKEAKENAESELASAKKEVADLTKRLEQIEAEAAERESEAKFNERMAALDDEFDLDDELRRVITEEIDGLDEEAFAAWKTRFDVMARKNKKKAKEDKVPRKEGDDEPVGGDKENYKEKEKASKASEDAEELAALKEKISGMEKLYASINPVQVTTDKYAAAMEQISGKGKEQK